MDQQFESLGNLRRIHSHPVTQDDISRNAIKVLNVLNQAGYEAYLVGGGVRDVLLGLKPKDFDIATNAHPEEIKSLFRNCRLIGRRFRLAHIIFGRDIIEVATFRGHHGEGEHSTQQQHIDYRDKSGHSKDGQIVRDNVFGTIEEDAVRRDFSVNALYFDIRDNSIVDYTDGCEDVKRKVLRLIGDPEVRYREDPVRMIRAVRFAAKLDFRIIEGTHEKIFEMGDLLGGIPAARLFDESLKLFQGGYGLRCFELLREYHLLQYLFPSVEKYFLHHDDDSADHFIRQALINTDKRLAIGKNVNPAFFLSVLLWGPLLELKQRFLSNGDSEFESLHKAAYDVIRKQQSFTSIPKRLSFMMKDIWFMQRQLHKPTRKHALRTLRHKRFRAAYDFMELRLKIGETQLQEAYNWWTEIQQKNEHEQHEMCNELKNERKKRRRPKHKKKSLEFTVSEK
jgi:poly(A) polymerase